MAPGEHQDASEVGNISRGRLSDSVEAESGFGAHGLSVVILTLVEVLVLETTKLKPTKWSWCFFLSSARSISS